MAKEFKSNITKPTDEQVLAASRGVPFKKCPNCGNSIGPSQPYCLECKRLIEIGFGPAPRAGGHGQPEPQTVGGMDQDTQEPQSYPSHRHDGYQDYIPNGVGEPALKKFPPKKERM